METNTNTYVNKVKRLQNSNLIILALTGIIFGVLLWLMVPFSTLGKVPLFLFFGIWFLVAPVSFAER